MAKKAARIVQLRDGRKGLIFLNGRKEENRYIVHLIDEDYKIRTCPKTGNGLIVVRAMSHINTIGYID